MAVKINRVMIVVTWDSLIAQVTLGLDCALGKYGVLTVRYYTANSNINVATATLRSVLDSYLRNCEKVCHIYDAMLGLLPAT